MGLLAAIHMEYERIMKSTDCKHQQDKLLKALKVRMEKEFGLPLPRQNRKDCSSTSLYKLVDNGEEDVT